MQTILFDIYPAIGHLNSTFKLARLLKENGFRVVYTGCPEHEESVKVLGFEFFCLNPFILTRENVLIKQKGLALYCYESFMDLFYKKRIEGAYSSIKRLDELILNLQPDLIVLDAHYIYKAAIYYKYKIRLISVQTMLATHRECLVPPLQSSLIPKTSVIYRSVIFFLWNTFILRKKWSYFIRSMLFFGRDNFSLLKKISSENGFPFKSRINYSTSIAIHFDGFTELILSPKDFDYQRRLNPLQHYVGPLRDLNLKIQSYEERYLSVIKEVQRKKEGNVKAVYCSLGTLTSDQLLLCESFFKNIVNVFQQDLSLLLILSIGRFFDISKLQFSSKNIFVFREVPQVHVLSFCDIMITHGGINSITECIFNEVPMIVFPLTSRSDQEGNAARVVYHSLGLRGKIKNSSSVSISSKVNKIRSNYTYYKNNVKQMKQRFDLSNNSDKALQLIQNTLVS